MNPVRAAFLSLFMLAGITLWGVGVYTADAASSHVAIDGYGVSADR